MAERKINKELQKQQGKSNRLNLEQNGFELNRLTYMWVFFQQLMLQCYTNSSWLQMQKYRYGKMMAIEELWMQTSNPKLYIDF